MTETQTVDLAVWLTRIWDEEERRENDKFKMRKGAPPLEWTYSAGGEWVYVRVDGSSLEEQIPGSEFRKRYLEPSPDPQVLVRIAADRKILALHYSAGPGHDGIKAIPSACVTCGWPDEYGVEWPCETVRLLASPYKGREGWQEAWE